MVALLIDGNNVAVRSYMAQQAMDVSGIDTGSLVLFVNTLARYVRLERPDSGMVCWDSGKSAFRTRLYPEYKANRKQKASDQAKLPIALMQTFLKLSRFPQLQLPGYEGDDLIYASWRACRGREQVRILSSDKDMLQMVEDGTEQLRLVSNGAKPDRWDRARFIREKGFKPEYQAWVLALTGDTADGVPGLRGVGPKTAIKMLTRHDWDMAALVESLTETQQARVLTNVTLVDLSFVPLELCAPPDLDLVGPDHEDWPALLAFCEKWQLNQIKTKLKEGRLWSN